MEEPTGFLEVTETKENDPMVNVVMQVCPWESCWYHSEHQLKEKISLKTSLYYLSFAPDFVNVLNILSP